MIEFTACEKNAIIALLIEIMQADTIIHPAEEEYLESKIKELSFDIKTYNPIDFTTCVMCVKNMTSVQRATVHNILVGMAEADGFVDPREIELIKQLSLM